MPLISGEMPGVELVSRRRIVLLEVEQHLETVLLGERVF